MVTHHNTYEVKTLGGSIVPSMQDCPRRAAYKLFEASLPEKYQQHKREEETPTVRTENVALRCGKAVHAGVEYGLLEKLDGREVTETDLRLAMEQIAINGDPTEDDTIVEIKYEERGLTDEGALLSSIRKMTPQVAKLVDRIEPLHIEEEFTCQPTFFPEPQAACTHCNDTNTPREAVCGYCGGDGSKWRLVIHPDVIDTHHIVHDVKTMKTLTNPPCYRAQLGTYVLALNELGFAVNGICVDAIEKPLKTRDSKEPAAFYYPLQASTEHALDRLVSFTQSADRFFAGEMDPRLFPANPSSSLCDKRWCPAFGTDFCELTKDN